MNEITILDCNNKNIGKIENLPKTLLQFFCKNNNISKIENLPSTLLKFDCGDNNISKIENLPKTLLEFSCCYNNISKIENLPPYLHFFFFDIGKIEFVDNIPFSYFNNKFDLLWYNKIKRFQRLIRRRHNKKVNAVKKIQRNCENWLWKPLCKDNTIGINIRLIQKLIF